MAKTEDSERKWQATETFPICCIENMVGVPVCVEKGHWFGRLVRTGESTRTNTRDSHELWIPMKLHLNSEPSFGKIN